LFLKFTKNKNPINREIEMPDSNCGFVCSMDDSYGNGDSEEESKESPMTEERKNFLAWIDREKKAGKERDAKK
jgi:hypothetical protein